MNTDNMLSDLRGVVHILAEKEKLGLIPPQSESTAKNLIKWRDDGRTWTARQEKLVSALLFRSRKGHKGTKVTIGGAPVDTRAIVEDVLSQIKNGGFGVDVQQVVESVIPHLGKKFTVDVTAQVMEQLEKRAPRRVEITVKKEGQKPVTLKGPTHYNFEKLVRAASCRLPNGYVSGIFLQGEASSGKTTGAKMLAEALGLKWYFNGAISFPHEMLGFIDGAGKYHRTPFRDAYEHGGVYTFDEVDRSDPNALLAVNPHLANGVATFPDKQIQRHKDCIIICTANTWGLGADANYSGATKLDAAFLSRFPIRINWDIDPALEEVIVDNAEWLAVVRKARARAREHGLKVLIDTRIAQSGAALLTTGFSIVEAAHMTFLANLKPEQRTQVAGDIL